MKNFQNIFKSWSVEAIEGRDLIPDLGADLGHILEGGTEGGPLREEQTGEAKARSLIGNLTLRT